MSGGSVQAVTVSYFSGGHLTELLRSLADDSIALVVVANNAPEDHSLASIVAENPRAKTLEIGSNRGYGGAVNAAVRARPSESEWILVINPDVVVEPGAIDELARIGALDPRIGVIGPRILTPGGEVYPSARRLPSLRTGIGHALFTRIWKGNPWTRAYLADREDPPMQREAGWLSGACMLIRRAAFAEVGGFDEKYFMYFEDVDICARIAKHNWRIVYAPSATVTHSGGHATSSRSHHMVRVHHHSAYVYLAGKYPQWYLAPLRLVLKVALQIRAALTRG